MHYRLHWLQVGITLLLGMALTACSRSASNGIMTITPLPSAPPPTATDILPTLTMAPLATATESESSTATSEPTQKPTATKALPTEVVTITSGSTPAACAGAPTTRLSAGLFAYVNPEPPLPNNLRSDPGENNELIGYIEPGQSMKILEGPECADGWIWWKVNTLETDLTGWTAEGDGQGYWLIPCASQAQCGP